VDPRTGLEECRKSRLQQDSIPGPSDRTKALNDYAFPAPIFAALPFRTTDLNYFLLVLTTDMTDTKELCSGLP